MSKQIKVGLIGLGVMGRGVAANLLSKGFDVSGFDVQQQARDWLTENGGRASTSLSDLADHAQIIVSFVVNSEQTEAVLYGQDGLVGKLPAGSIFIACSTMDPAYVQGLSERLKRESIHLIDAPVTGGSVGAAKGTLTIMGSGDGNAFEEVRPVLEAFGKRVYHLGAAGSGAKMKVLNQLLCGVNLAAAAEAMALAKQLELPLDTTFEILRSGAGTSWMLEDRGQRMIEDNYDNAGAAVDIFVKDMSLVLDATRATRFAAPFAHTAYLAFIEASARGLGAKDGAIVTTNYAS